MYTQITDKIRYRETTLFGTPGYEFQILKRSWLGLGPKTWRTETNIHEYEMGVIFCHIALGDAC